MSKSENTPDALKSSIFIRIGQRMLSLANRFFHFFSAPDNNLPDNEAGELMRRYLQHKSWFDRLCASWAKTPFYLKTFYIALTVSVLAVVGIFTGSSILLALSGLALALTANTLALVHEKHRFKRATLFTKEHIELTRVLNEGQKKLDKTSKKLGAALERVEKTELEVNAQIKTIETEQKRLEEAMEKLIVKVNEIESQTSQLICKQKEMNGNITQWGEEIQKGTKATENLTEKVQTVDASVSQFSGTVDDMEKSQQEFSKAVSEFSIFVKKTPETKASMCPGLQKFMDEEDECDVLIAKLRSNASNSG